MASLTIRTRNGNTQAIVRVKQNGVVTHSESRTFEKESLARDWGKRLKDKLEKEGTAERKLVNTDMAALITKYRAAREAHKPLRRAMSHELDQLTGHVGAWRLDNLQAHQFTQFALARRREGAGPVTVQHNLATLRAILNAAKPMFGIDASGEVVSEAMKALANMGHVSKSTQRERRPTEDELNRLHAEFERIAPHPSTIIPMSQILRLAIELPRRLGELLDMTWEDYTGRVQTLRDTKHPTKPRTEVVPVPPAAAAIINALPKIDARILPYKSESVSASFQRACERLKIEDLHFHDLRHEGICRLFERGLAIQEVALISGHQSWNMLRRYTHLKPENVLEKLQ